MRAGLCAGNYFTQSRQECKEAKKETTWYKTLRLCVKKFSSAKEKNGDKSRSLELFFSSLLLLKYYHS